MTHPNQRAIVSFHESFAARDAEGMIAAYDPRSIRFSDPVFTDLQGDEPGAMWRMLVGRAADLAVDFRDVSADDESGKAYWEARYTFSKTGRKVLNRVRAEFRFHDGKIVEHRDHFDLYAWTRQALGPIGTLVGWSPLLQAPLRRSAKKELRRFMKKTGA